MSPDQENFFQRNSELSIEFSKYVLEHPEMDDLIQEDRIIVFIPEFDDDLKSFNLRMAKDIDEEGGKVIYVKVKNLTPKIPSRLVGVEVRV
jgi:phage pi2 protein 07